MYLLNLCKYFARTINDRDLHSTMYLLNLLTPFSLTWSIKFTFHYVSIKSKKLHIPCMWHHYLHSTMYLLNPMFLQQPERKCNNLHSTMYLLNPNETAKYVRLFAFTFHYVSIKSK